jgi:hypothetical protein
MQRLLLLFGFFIGLSLQAQFAPAAGQPGSSALHKDSNLFKAWATQCNITRGYQDISNVLSGLTTVGDSSMALGKAGDNGIVSLGDGGTAIVTLNTPFKNGPGPDFAIFENTFIDSFLELAFVEVSSDGKNYVRFKPTSFTQDSIQTGPFGYTNPKKINNLAGKYRALYGTPFDLEELALFSNINIGAITHIKIIDVVGSINNQYAQYDQYNHKINDPWPTPFPSSGFDLDAVGVIYPVGTSIQKTNTFAGLKLFPNPANNYCNIEINTFENHVCNLTIFDAIGKLVFEESFSLSQGLNLKKIDLSNYDNGCYQICISKANETTYLPIIIAHE